MTSWAPIGKSIKAQRIPSVFSLRIRLRLSFGWYSLQPYPLAPTKREPSSHFFLEVTRSSRATILLLAISQWYSSWLSLRFMERTYCRGLTCVHWGIQTLTSPNVRRPTSCRHLPANVSFLTNLPPFWIERNCPLPIGGDFGRFYATRTWPELSRSVFLYLIIIILLLTQDSDDLLRILHCPVFIAVLDMESLVTEGE